MFALSILSPSMGTQHILDLNSLKPRKNKLLKLAARRTNRDFFRRIIVFSSVFPYSYQTAGTKYGQTVLVGTSEYPFCEVSIHVCLTFL